LNDFATSSLLKEDSMYQKIVIVGHLGADPEMRYTPTGQAYSRFSVATDRKWTDAEGHLQQETTWYRVTVWGKQAEACNQYLAKGRQVLVEGERLHASAYLNKENQPAASLELTARFVRFLGGRPGANGNGAGAEEVEAETEGELAF
jgi:single-strand DNA-binding protein